MGRLIELVKSTLNKVMQTMETLEQKVPGAKMYAYIIAGTLLVSILSKPKDTSVYKMPTRELIHKYYGTEYKEDKTEEEETFISDITIRQKSYPFGRIG